MARRTTYREPKMAVLTMEKMQYGIVRLEKLIEEIQAFDPQTVQKRWSNEVKALEINIEGVLSSVFGHGTVEYNRYKRAAELDNGPVTVRMAPDWGGRGGSGYHDDTLEAREYVSEGKDQSIQILRQAVAWLQSEITAHGQSVSGVGAETTAQTISRKAFIVHGHDDGAREAVARFLEKIGFQAIILHEQPSQGRTIIEKVEAHGEVGFAIVLLTPDDTGCKIEDTPRPRPRQNVLLELGYFIGRLGRAKVCTLITDNTMELPTDFAGVVWQAFDSSGGWKQALGRELEAAGFDIDWNKVMKA
ncbi:MAG: TIR domain-containing protein [Syntrophobacteraceae bacterium]